MVMPNKPVNSMSGMSARRGRVRRLPGTAIAYAAMNVDPIANLNRARAPGEYDATATLMATNADADMTSVTAAAATSSAARRFSPLSKVVEG